MRLVLLALIVDARGISGIFTPDTAGYVHPMLGLLHGSFSSNGLAELHRPPGYPVFLLLSGLGKQAPELWVSWQIVLSLISIVFVYKTAIVIFESQRIASFCAILYAVEPVSVLYSDLLFPDCIFVCLLTIFIYCTVTYFRFTQMRWLIWSAVTITGCTYIKPVSYYLPACFAAGFIILPRGMSPARRVFGSACFLALCTLLIGGWQVRNYDLTGYPGFSSATEQQLYFYDAAGVVARQRHIDFFKAQEQLAADAEDWARPPGESENRFVGLRLRRERAAAISILKEAPLLYAKLHLRGVLVVLFDPNGTDLLRYLNVYPAHGGLMAMVVSRGILKTILWLAANRPIAFCTNLFLAAWMLLYYCLAVIGWPRTYIFADVFWVLVLMTAYFILVAGGPAAYGRYRDPVMPIVCIFAGAGIATLIDRFGTTAKRRESLHTST